MLIVKSQSVEIVLPVAEISYLDIRHTESIAEFSL